MIKAGHCGAYNLSKNRFYENLAEAQEEARNFILEQYGKDYVPEVTRNTIQKQAQDAHEAIRPTSVYRSPEAVEKF